MLHNAVGVSFPMGSGTQSRKAVGARMALIFKVAGGGCDRAPGCGFGLGATAGIDGQLSFEQGLGLKVLGYQGGQHALMLYVQRHIYKYLCIHTCMYACSIQVLM